MHSIALSCDYRHPVSIITSYEMSDRTSAPESEPATPVIRIFISYASDDNAIVEVLRNELVNFDLSRIDVFQDTHDLRAGDKWKETILYKLQQADWFIGVFTGKQRTTFSYPG